MKTINTLVIALIFLGSLSLYSCSKSDQNQASTPPVAKQAALGLEGEAKKAAEEFWGTKITKCGNSHYTAGEGLVFHEFMGLSIGVFPSPISEIDKLNGIEWKGLTRLFAKATRAYHPKGWEGWGPDSARWLDWIEGAKVEGKDVDALISKKKGRWHVDPVGSSIIMKAIKCSEIPSGG